VQVDAEELDVASGVASTTRQAGNQPSAGGSSTSCSTIVPRASNPMPPAAGRSTNSMVG